MRDESRQKLAELLDTVDAAYQDLRTHPDADKVPGFGLTGIGSGIRLFRRGLNPAQQPPRPPVRTPAPPPLASAAPDGPDWRERQVPKGDR